MDKYELKVSMDEIDRLIAERRFAEAADIADTIDWTRVKGVQVLCRISDLYKINKRYKDSRDLMEIAYERKPSSRKIIYSLCELELKLNNYIHALQLYNAFINVAPRDPDRFVLQYKLYKKQEVNVLEQIAALRDELGISVLMVEQQAELALSIADYGYVLQNGRIRLQGPASELLHNPQVQEAYLGGAH